jgi:hypothetical protein
MLENKKKNQGAIINPHLPCFMNLFFFFWSEEVASSASFRRGGGYEGTSCIVSFKAGTGRAFTNIPHRNPAPFLSNNNTWVVVSGFWGKEGERVLCPLILVVVEGGEGEGRGARARARAWSYRGFVPFGLIRGLALALALALFVALIWPSTIR